jgi:hypothetical protein
MDASGQFNGDILTGPVRLAFCNLDKLPEKKPNHKSEPKFGSHILFTPLADYTIFHEEYAKVCQREFADKYNPHDGQYYGLRSPFRNQAEKMKFGGYTAGCVFMNCTSKFKVPVVDARGNHITDWSKVYPGVWAICAVNAYAYKDPTNPGVAFGLQSVMLIGDDTKLGGGAQDPKKFFGNVNVQAPVVRPDVAGMMPQGAMPAPAAAIPGYTNVGGGMGAPAMGAPAQFVMPQTHFTPPAATPMQYAPAAQPDDDDMSAFYA